MTPHDAAPRGRFLSRAALPETLWRLLSRMMAPYYPDLLRRFLRLQRVRMGKLLAATPATATTVRMPVTLDTTMTAMADKCRAWINQNTIARPPTPLA